MWLPTLALVWTLTLAGSPAATLVVLENARPLVEQFNAHTDQRRFIAILSPT
jgi:hypothetical protein